MTLSGNYVVLTPSGVQFDNNVWIDDAVRTQSAKGGNQLKGRMTFLVEEYSAPYNVTPDAVVYNHPDFSNLNIAVTRSADRYTTKKCATMLPAQAREKARPKTFEAANDVAEYAHTDFVARGPRSDDGATGAGSTGERSCSGSSKQPAAAPAWTDSAR